MKIKITYLPGEEKWAYMFGNLAIAALRKATGNPPRVKERQEHPPYRHIYISSKPPEVPTDTVES